MDPLEALSSLASVASRQQPIKTKVDGRSNSRRGNQGPAAVPKPVEEWVAALLLKQGRTKMEDRVKDFVGRKRLEDIEAQPLSWYTEEFLPLCTDEEALRIWAKTLDVVKHQMVRAQKRNRVLSRTALLQTELQKRLEKHRDMLFDHGPPQHMMVGIPIHPRLPPRKLPPNMQHLHSQHKAQQAAPSSAQSRRRSRA